MIYLRFASKYLGSGVEKNKWDIDEINWPWIEAR